MAPEFFASGGYERSAVAETARAASTFARLALVHHVRRLGVGRRLRLGGVRRAHPSQRVYGLGELEDTGSAKGCPDQPNQRAFPLHRGGMTVQLDTTKFHVSVPFMVSSLGYALLVNVPGGGQVAVGNGTGTVRWTLPAVRQLDVWVTALPAGAGPGLQPLYTQYFAATGMPSALPRLRYRTTDEAIGVAREFGARNVSLGVFVIDFHNQKTDGQLLRVLHHGAEGGHRPGANVDRDVVERHVLERQRRGPRVRRRGVKVEPSTCTWTRCTRSGLW